MNFDSLFTPRTLTERRENEYHHRVELRDGAGRFLGEVGDYDDLEWVVSSDAEDMEASQITMPKSSAWSRTFMRANMRILLVHIMLYREDKLVKTWTGRVDRSVRSTEGPQGTVKVELISDKGWLSYISLWSAPFSALWFQAPKSRIKAETSIFGMKQFLIDNLLRLQSSASDWNKASLSLYHQRPADWSWMQTHLYPVCVEPTPKHEDTSPFSILTVRMTNAASMMQEVCKDYNLLPVVRFHVPGRDPAPNKIHMARPGIVIDILDKEKSRVRGTRPDVWNQLSSILGPFFRGLFGRHDTPPVVDTSTIDGLVDFFGKDPDDPWVIFRQSPSHWSSTEVASYAPTTTSSITGDQSPEFLNKGITLIANGLISGLLSMIGLGFVGNLITGELDDILFAYQKADDPDLREFLGDFAFFEDFSGQGTTAYSAESAQALRSARWSAIGYKTATFSGDAASAPPFRPFEDFDLLDPVGWEDPDEERIIPDRMKQISVREDREGVSFEFRLGELERPEEPWAIQQRRNKRFEEAINAAIH